jgi:hypothetical protein
MRTPKQQSPCVEPPRPRCASCGQPGAYFVALKIEEMRLERDAGVGSRPYWTADYRSGSKLEVVLCDACQRSSVSIATSVSATMAHAKEKP